MTRGSKAVLLGVFGLTIYLLGESFHPAEVQPSARLCGLAIDAYQAVGSPAFRAVGAHCRYTPTCSHYAEDAISHFGTLGGTFRSAGRLWRCSPWGGAGHDPAVASLFLQDDGRPQPQPQPQETPDAAKSQEQRDREEAERLGRELGKGCAQSGVFCVIFIIMGLAGFVVHIFMMVYTYKDSKARGDTNGVLWLVLVFFFPIVGFIVYFFARPKGDLAPCANCKNKRMTTLVKCPHCGTDTGAAAAPPPKA